MADLDQQLRSAALKCGEVEETIACKGTAIEQSAYKVAGRAFLFAQRKQDQLILRLKLAASFDEVTGAAAKEPARYEPGKGGWITARLPNDLKASAALLKWVAESYALMAGGKKKATRVEAKPASRPTRTKKKPAKKKPAKKKPAKKKPAKKKPAKKKPAKKKPAKKKPAKKKPAKKKTRVDAKPASRPTRTKKKPAKKKKAKR